MMGIFDKLFNLISVKQQDYFKVILTDQWLSVKNPKHDVETVNWDDIHTIQMVNTREGPWSPNLWLMIIAKHGHCRIPHDASGFDAVYDVVSKYKGFDFENFNKSLTCNDNTAFLLWSNELSLQH